MTEVDVALGDLDDENWSVLERIARSVQATTDYQDTLDSILASAIQLVDGAVWAGLILLENGRLTPVAVKGEPPRQLDALQAAWGEGPCIHAAAQQEIVSIEDTAAEEHWPRFLHDARGLCVASMLCVPLRAHTLQCGALSLYSDRPMAFDKQGLAVARLFAVQAALVLDDARRVAQLTEAISSRDLIGQAKGILMERHRVTPDEAFALLRKASQVTNTKLVEVSRRLAESGELPGS